MGDAGIITDFNLKLARETEGMTLDLWTVAAGGRGPLLKDPAKKAFIMSRRRTHKSWGNCA